MIPAGVAGPEGTLPTPEPTPARLFDLLGAFVAVAETGAFRRAAERLGRSQPTVTAQVRQLEAALGTALFHRSTRRTVLTAAGAELLDRARRLVAEAERLVGDMAAHAAGGRGRVSLSVSPTVGAGFVSAATAAFEAASPDVSLSVREDMGPAMFDALATGDADLGIGPYAEPPDALRFAPLCAQPFLLICPRAHPLAARAAVTVVDLAGIDLICPARGTTARALIEAAAERAGVAIRARHEAREFVTLADMVAAGLGVTVMPLANRRLVEAFGLVALPFAEAAMVRTVGVLTRRGEPHPPAVAAFLRFLAAEARGGPLLADHGLAPLPGG